MIIDLYIGNDKLELFKDETVELNSSINTIDDITKNTTDYTKSFTVPASDINNQIFKHYYEANIDNTFDARVKVAGRIELGGIPFKYGKWRLHKVSLEHGNPKDYTINFWGNGVSLKDKFKEDKLNTLDLSEFDHEYSDTNVKQGLESSLFSGNIVYNLFTKRQIYYKNIATDNVNTQTLVNVAYGGGASTGVNWYELKPSLRLSKVVEAIATKYNLNFSEDFFSREEFQKLFLWLQYEQKVKGQSKKVNFTGGDTTYVNLTTDIGTYTTYITGVFNYKRYLFTLNIIPTIGYENVNYKVITYANGVVKSENQYTGNSSTNTSSQLLGYASGTFELYYEIESDEQFSYTCELLQTQQVRTSFSSITNTYYTTTGIDTLTSTFNVSANLPNMKVLDFMKGLFSMFKLVVIADNDNNVYINTLNDYYAQGIVYDLTKYIDFSKNDVERGNIYNTINFGFKEPTTLLNTQFKLNTGLAYGDEELILEDEDGNLLDGDKLDVKVQFEQIVYERLKDLNDNSQTNIQYGGIFDDKIEAVNPSAHIYYNINTSLDGKLIAFRNSFNAKQSIATLNIPSHTINFTSPQYSTVFSEEFNEWDGTLIDNTLYSNYYKNYVDSVFNIKKRNFKFSSKNIPIRILTKLELKDIIRIKNDYYRISNYNFNLLTGETTFNLINSFDNTILPFNADRTTILADFTQQIQSIYVTNLTAFDYVSSETWVTSSNNGNIVYFNIDENFTGTERRAIVTIINTDTLREIEVLIIQSNGVTKFDNNIITFDNNLITWDNG